MSNIVITKIDTRGLKAKISAISKYVQVEPEKLIRHQTALLVKELTEISLPKSIPRTKKQIESTVYKSFYPKKGGSTAIVYKRYFAVRYGKGKVTGKKVPVKPSVITAFIAKQKKLIGTLAAGWIADGNPTGAVVKSVVKKAKSYGSYAEYKSPTGFSIVLKNLVNFGTKAFGGYYPKLVQNAVTRREKIIVAMVSNWAKSGKIRYQIGNRFK